MNPSYWTYDPTLGTDRDKVRFLIGDTDDLNKIFDDNEIDGTLVLEDGIYNAAAALAENLEARYSGALPSITVDGLSVEDRGQRAKQYADLARRLRDRSPGGLGTPFVGGVSVSEMNSVDADTDRPHSRFRIGQDQFQEINPSVDRLTTAK